MFRQSLLPFGLCLLFLWLATTKTSLHSHTLQPPLRYLHRFIRSFLSLLFSRLNGPSSLSLPSHMWYPSPSSTLVSLCWTLSCTPVSLLHREAQNWTLLQVWSHQCWIKGQDHLPCSLGYSLQQGHIPGSCSTSYAPGLPAPFWPCCFSDDPQHIILHRIVLPQVQKILHFSLIFVGLPVTHFFSLYPLKRIFYYVKYFAPCNWNWTRCWIFFVKENKNAWFSSLHGQVYFHFHNFQ